MKTEALHFSRLHWIGGAADADHEVRAPGDDHFEARAHEAADLGNLQSFNGKIAVGRHADQAIAEAEREEGFGDAGREGNNSLRRRRGRRLRQRGEPGENGQACRE